MTACSKYLFILAHHFLASRLLENLGFRTLLNRSVDYLTKNCSIIRSSASLLSDRTKNRH